ncbi:hypothetical protein [Nocardioides ultimimeridianus]
MPARLAVAGVLVAACLATLAGASQASSPGRLPPWSPPSDALAAQGNVANTGRGEVVANKQWFRVPVTPTFVRAWIKDDQVHAEVFARTGKSGYGEFSPFSVRSVAFGIAPAVVTIRMSQLRRADGTVEPWVLVGPVSGSGQTLRGRVVLGVTRMSVDGHDVATLRAGCHTAFPAWVQLTGQDGYSPINGGSLSGTIDVPPFVGCGRGNDQLLTSFVSGAGSPLEIRQGSILSGNTPDPFPLPGRG